MGNMVGREHTAPGELWYPPRPMNALDEQAARWLADDPDPATRDALGALLAAGAGGHPELADCFAGALVFGTAGLRGLLGPGPNRMNRAMVRRTTAAVAEVLVGRVPGAAKRGVVVGYDGRRMSREFAEDAARVLAGQGLVAHLFDAQGPTPLTAFALRHLEAAGAVMITASHNPPAYNGYKLYWEHGAQIVSPLDVEIAAAMAALPGVSDLPLPTLEEARVAGRVRAVPEAVVGAYLEGVRAMALHPGEGSPLKIAYTALHGVGDALATAVLGRFGEVRSVPEQAQPDGAFPTVNFPNPEEPGAMDRVFALGSSIRADLVLANDPDADRLAAAIPLPGGGFRALTGNEVGVLLGHYLLTEGPALGRPMVATSIVSSPLLGRIAHDLGADYAETLTGFKWIMHRSAELAAATGARFVFGYEEALGYCAGELVRDKDGISAAYLLAELASTLKARGQTLAHRLDEIARRHGLYLSGQHTETLPGADGAAAIAARMAQLRGMTVAELDGRQVVERADYLRGVVEGRGVERPTGLPPSDVLRFDLHDGARVMVRPSGTEPKIKYYFDQRGEVGPDGSLDAARERAATQLRGLMTAFLAL